MAEHRFPPDEAGHLGIRLVVQQAVERVLAGLSAARIGCLVHMQRQTGDGLGDDPHAGVDRRNLNGRGRGDGLAGKARAVVKAGRGGDGVPGRCPPGGLVPGAEQAKKWIFHKSLLIAGMKKAPHC